jgi:archaellum component FlaC
MSSLENERDMLARQVEDLSMKYEQSIDIIQGLEDETQAAQKEIATFQSEYERLNDVYNKTNMLYTEVSAEADRARETLT